MLDAEDSGSDLHDLLEALPGAAALPGAGQIPLSFQGDREVGHGDQGVGMLGAENLLGKLDLLLEDPELLARFVSAL